MYIHTVISELCEQRKKKDKNIKDFLSILIMASSSSSNPTNYGSINPSSTISPTELIQERVLIREKISTNLYTIKKNTQKLERIQKVLQQYVMLFIFSKINLLSGYWH